MSNQIYVDVVVDIVKELIDIHHNPRDIDINIEHADYYLDELLKVYDMSGSLLTHIWYLTEEYGKTSKEALIYLAELDINKKQRDAGYYSYECTKLVFNGINDAMNFQRLVANAIFLAICIIKDNTKDEV